MNDTDDIRKGRPSASSAHYNTLCRGRHKMCMPFPEETSAAAIDGTAQHFRMENPTFKIREDLIPATETAAEQRDSVIGLVWNDWKDNPPEVHLEQRLWYRGDRFSGQADYVGVRDGKALIIDYKFGRGSVSEAATNQQLMWLAVLIDYHYKVDQVTVAIVQPHAGTPTLHTYVKDEFGKIRRRVLAVVRDIDSKHAKLRAGEVQCRYCKAINICPAVEGKRNALSKLDPEKTTDLTNAHLASVLPSLSAIRLLCDKLEDEAIERLRERPELFKGWGLKTGSGRREIVDPAKAYDDLIEAKVIDESGLSRAMNLRLDKLKRVLQEYNEVSFREADAIMEETLGENLKKHEGKVKLCRAE